VFFSGEKVTVNGPSCTTHSPQTDHKNTTVCRHNFAKPLQNHHSTTPEKNEQLRQIQVPTP
jgi:hypothetical protein